MTSRAAATGRVPRTAAAGPTATSSAKCGLQKPLPQPLRAKRPELAQKTGGAGASIVCPGSSLPAWAVEVLATWPHLHPAWWEDEGFCLAAAALGIHGPPPPPRPTTPDTSLADWERVAEEILARDFTAEPADASTIKSWEIGLRSLASRSPVCRRARGKLEVITPAKWRKVDLAHGRLLPRSVRLLKQCA